MELEFIEWSDLSIQGCTNNKKKRGKLSLSKSKIWKFPSHVLGRCPPGARTAGEFCTLVHAPRTAMSTLSPEWITAHLSRRHAVSQLSPHSGSVVPNFTAEAHSIIITVTHIPTTATDIKKEKKQKCVKQGKFKPFNYNSQYNEISCDCFIDLRTYCMRVYLLYVKKKDKIYYYKLNYFSQTCFMI